MLETIYTTKTAGLKLGRSHKTITAHAVKHGIGRKVGRQWLFTEKDLARLQEHRDRGPGKYPKDFEKNA